MPSLSLCMIVKDEEEFLEDCLNHVKDHADEIIIVDTGSKDRTKEIAGKFTDNVFDFIWEYDFSKARNFSLSKATKDWILVLDADEVLADMEKVIGLINNAKQDAFFLIQRNYTNDSSQANWTPADNNPYCRNYKGYVKNPIIRLFRNNKGIKFSGVVHEVVDSSVKKYDVSDIPIHHYYEKKSLINRQLKYLEIAEKELKKNPSGRIYAIAATVNLKYKKDYKKAVEYFQKAVQLNFEPDKNLEGMAEAHIKAREFNKAYDIYKKLAKACRISAAGYNNLANILFMYRHYSAALKFLKLALKKGNPNIKRIRDNIMVIENILNKKNNPVSKQAAGS
ncbi:glycosyltransferase family 2 protein [Candidatus Woesearchaeota archaeon]|nr:glycosyltransferase family 2 protein [Candidatus Woesearchaeota archaeon]